MDAFEMAKSQARAGAMLTRMTALVYIRPEDLLAPPGATKPGLQYLCNGGFGAVYRGMWQVRVGATRTPGPGGVACQARRGPC